MPVAFERRGSLLASDRLLHRAGQGYLGVGCLLAIGIRALKSLAFVVLRLLADESKYISGRPLKQGARFPAFKENVGRRNSVIGYTLGGQEI